MTDDSQSEEPSHPQFAAVRELAGLWVRSQPVISAYITANVFDMHHAEDLVQEVAQTVAEKFATFDRQPFVRVVGVGNRPQSAAEILPDPIT